MSIKKFNYDGKPITFEFTDGNKMINATQMAKPFGKRVNDYLRLNATKEYVLLLEKRYSNSRYGNSRNGKREVLRIVQGGSPELQGTWMDEKLALEFASWLSPAFKLWVYDCIEELLKTGKTELPSHRPGADLIKAIRMIADKLEYQQRDIDQNKEAIAEIRDYVHELNAKITAIDENYYSISGYCALNHIDCPLPFAQKMGRRATGASNAKGYAIGKAFSTIYGEVGSYHIDILDDVFKHLK